MEEDTATAESSQTAYDDLKRLTPSLAAEVDHLRASLREHNVWLQRYGQDDHDAAPPTVPTAPQATPPATRPLTVAQPGEAPPPSQQPPAQSQSPPPPFSTPGPQSLPGGPTTSAAAAAAAAAAASVQPAAVLGFRRAALHQLRTGRGRPAPRSADGVAERRRGLAAGVLGSFCAAGCRVASARGRCPGHVERSGVGQRVTRLHAN
ncbi:hypothetical protein SPI_02093 [Niveomyces insectorum RCEF 264]|uniref:Uncharacterized protein n=1 Tax=Niveomyces insectorum RCEF 264 TaxID=1081102 RepID=A0A167XRT6_9HYPO|nr:hypothetical protein SPI_02093 [Niveomyces insectorum RCEF 264]